MLKLCKNFHGLLQKVLQPVAEFVPTRVNEVLVLISLESPCFHDFVLENIMLVKRRL